MSPKDIVTINGGGTAVAAAEDRGRALDRIIDKLGLYFHGAWENPSWILIFTLGRIVAVRELLRTLSGRPPLLHGERTSLLADVPVDQVVADLQGDGIHLGIHLPDATRDAIFRFATTNVCYGAFDRRCAFLADDHAAAEQTFDRRFLVGHFLETIERCPEIQALQADPVLREIAARYIRADPLPIATRLWWSFPSEGARDHELRQAAQDRLHPDINDWRSVKFFFYLTDVDEDTGAHLFVRRTHRRRHLRHQFTLFTGHSHAALVAAYGEDAFMTVCGPAGFGFVEDPFAFHTGTIVRRTRRLILQIEYGVTPVSADRFYGG